MKCIILAGGSGERLWPVSRDLYPKSLLSLFDDKSMIQNVCELAQNVCSSKDIVAVTNIRLLDNTRIQLNKIDKKINIIAEPLSKNTAPAIASGLVFLEKKKDDIVAILPVDFAVENVEAFIDTLENAKQMAKTGKIVCIGVKPSYPEEGFGYIETGDIIKTGRKVNKFIEKPMLSEIEEFIKNENYYWNSGIYVAKISVLKEALNQYVQGVSDFSKDMFDSNNKIYYSFYENLKSESVDYAVMEKTDNLVLVEMESDWKDYGSWQALYKSCEKTSEGNVFTGNVVADKVKNSFVYSSKELVAVSDIEDTVVIETEDALLVCDKSNASDINKIVKKLKESSNSVTGMGKTVYRPWGYYTCLNNGEGWLSKIITVMPNHKLSLQSHKYRSEHWVVLEGNACVILNDTVNNLEKGQSINIPIEAKHSLQNNSDVPLKILEVQKGSYISEDDIVRYEDMYGRVS